MGQGKQMPLYVYNVGVPIFVMRPSINQTHSSQYVLLKYKK